MLNTNVKFIYFFNLKLYTINTRGVRLMKSAREIFAENLQKLLNERKVDQSELARYLGISNASVSYWLSGEKYPRIDKIQKIADFFNIPKSQLTEEYPSTLMELSMNSPYIGCLFDGELVELDKYVLGENLEFNDTQLNRHFFYLKVQNDSMEPTIPNQSYVLIRKQNEVKNGDIVAVRINSSSEITIMRVRHKEDNVMYLAPDNPNYEVILFDGKNQELEIIGKAITYTVKL